MFFDALYAQGGAPAAAGNSWGIFIPMILMVVVFYFLIIRPQNKKEKERVKMIDALKKGDKVLTAGGIQGEVTGVRAEEGVIVVKIADGVKVDFAKSAITQKL